MLLDLSQLDAGTWEITCFCEALCQRLWRLLLFAFPCCVDGCFFHFIWRGKFCRKLVHQDRERTLGLAAFRIQSRMWHNRSFVVENPTFFGMQGKLAVGSVWQSTREKQETDTARGFRRQETISGVFWSQPLSVKAVCVCVTVWSTMFPAIVALVVFECLEWTESLVTARLSWTTRTLLEPILLDSLETLVRRATGVRGPRYALVSLQFPGFNIVRLRRLTALDTLRRINAEKNFVYQSSLMIHNCNLIYRFISFCTFIELANKSWGHAKASPKKNNTKAIYSDANNNCEIFSFISFLVFSCSRVKTSKGGGKGQRDLRRGEGVNVPPPFYLGVHDFGSWLCARNGWGGSSTKKSVVESSSRGRESRACVQDSA